MIVTNSPFRLTIGGALLAGTVVLVGCGPTPVTRTSTSEQTTITAPPPVVSTTITTDEEKVKPVHAARAHRWHARYAAHGHRASPDRDEVTREETTTTVAPVATTSTTRKSTETSTTIR